MSVFAEAIQKVIDQKEYEVTTVVRVRAVNPADAIIRALDPANADRLGTTVKEVKS